MITYPHSVSNVRIRTCYHRDSKVIMFSPCELWVLCVCVRVCVCVCVCACVCVFVCYDFCPDHLVIKGCCHTSTILHSWRCLVLKDMYHVFMTSSMTSPSYKVDFRHENIIPHYARKSIFHGGDVIHGVTWPQSRPSIFLYHDNWKTNKDVIIEIPIHMDHGIVTTYITMCSWHQWWRHQVPNGHGYIT